MTEDNEKIEDIPAWRRLGFKSQEEYSEWNSFHGFTFYTKHRYKKKITGDEQYEEGKSQESTKNKGEKIYGIETG